jgi:hypothetical protein
VFVCVVLVVYVKFFFYGGKQKAKIFFNFFLSQLMKVSKKKFRVDKDLKRIKRMK